MPSDFYPILFISKVIEHIGISVGQYFFLNLNKCK